MSEQKTPTWSLLGCGCAVLVLGALLIFAGVTFVTYRQAERFKAGYDGDPEAAAARVRAVLPHAELPAGYYPLGGLSVPFLFDLAVLTDLPPGERSPRPGTRRFRERGLLYVSTLSPRRDDAQVRAYFEEGPEPAAGGRGDDMELVIPDDEIGSDLALAFESRELVGRGRVALPGGEAYYAARRGELSISGRSSPGLATFLYMRCAGGGRRLRLGLWFAAEPQSRPAEGVEAGGAATEELAEAPPSPADPQALEAFLAPLRVCS